MPNISHLFSPLKIRDVTLRNRIGLSPMSMYSYQDGISNDWQLIHLGARAAGGAGLIITEATAVEARGRITPYDAGIWTDEQVGPLARVVKTIKDCGAVAGIQISHAGRKASCRRPWEGGKPISPEESEGWLCVAPSAIAYKEGSFTPKALTVDEIRQIQLSFRAGAQRALAAGFEWLELHAAHGYLMHSFLSPLSNHRSDSYGGSFENRTRFLLETLQTIQKVWPENLPLTVRISATDWTKGGWTLDESIQLAKILQDERVDLVDCSSGGVVAGAGVRISTGPGYQVSFADAIRRESGIPTAAVGMITTPEQADEIIRNGRADLVMLGRAMLYNPNWPLHAALKLKQSAPIPNPYLRGF